MESLLYWHEASTVAGRHAGGRDGQVGQDMQRSTYLYTMWQRRTASSFWKMACVRELLLEIHLLPRYGYHSARGVKPQVEAKIDVQIALVEPASFG